jgi:hypothetical protein
MKISPDESERPFEARAIRRLVLRGTVAGERKYAGENAG